MKKNMEKSKKFLLFKQKKMNLYADENDLGVRENLNADVARNQAGWGIMAEVKTLDRQEGIGRGAALCSRNYESRI